MSKQCKALGLRWDEELTKVLPFDIAQNIYSREALLIKATGGGGGIRHSGLYLKQYSC